MVTRLYELADALRHHARKRHMPPDHALGRRGEDIAHRFLQRAGIIVVARNYRQGSASAPPGDTAHPGGPGRTGAARSATPTVLQEPPLVM